MSGRRLCAHADLDGKGMHFLESGEVCPRVRDERMSDVTETPTLADFLLVRLAEDEAVAKRAAEDYGVGGEWRVVDLGYEGIRLYSEDDGPAAHGDFDTATTAHMQRHDPARVLADVEAKRQIVAMHSVAEMGGGQYDPECHEDGYGLPDPNECRTLRLLARVYADRADWREEWAL